MSRLGGLIECIFLWRGVCWMNEWREEQWGGGTGRNNGVEEMGEVFLGLLGIEMI